MLRFLSIRKLVFEISLTVSNNYACDYCSCEYRGAIAEILWHWPRTSVNGYLPLRPPSGHSDEVLPRELCARRSICLYIVCYIFRWQVRKGMSSIWWNIFIFIFIKVYRSTLVMSEQTFEARHPTGIRPHPHPPSFYPSSSSSPSS